ncbi:MAG: glycosyl transferase [Candidatus Omnitrophica bacterium CG11_big_fil_rev_8_21_14_0_20_43_6]|nr:MAG: glycosyl transferase [Candidatus Omnitrophica bacterium CG11_big_fil_rev_8_21_14_0_20_43_6]
MPAISVVVLTYNSRDYLKSCLDALFNQLSGDGEVVLVDNGSEDATPDFIKANYPRVRLIENSENLGAAKARNQGIEAAGGEWILTLDCDVVLEEGFMSKIVEFAKNSPDSTGMIQPKILSGDGTKIYSCGIYAAWLGRFYDIGKGSFDRSRFNRQAPVFGACCAAALYRRKMLETVKDRYGYFDQRFFFLFEDADLSWRAKRQGWVCRYYPEVKCYHQANSSATGQGIRQFLSFRNRQLTILKNQNLLLTFFMLPLYLAYDLPRFLILAIKFKCKFPKFK